MRTAFVPGNSYQWTGPSGFNSTNQNVDIPKVVIDDKGTYTLVETQNGCLSFIASKNIVVLPGPGVNLGNDTAICIGNSLLLNVANMGYSYRWNTGDTTQSIVIADPGIYSVTVSNGVCSSDDDILITGCAADLWLPNVFTPNSDSHNDRFRPVYKGIIVSYQIRIFNRWGQQLYESPDPYIGWDGTFSGNPCPTGVYYFLIEYTLATETTPKQKVKRGAVTLLR